jgi:hypothetical protein
MVGRAPILIPNGKASLKIWNTLIAANNSGSCISFIIDVYLDYQFPEKRLRAPFAKEIALLSRRIPFLERPYWWYADAFGKGS